MTNDCQVLFETVAVSYMYTGPVSKCWLHTNLSGEEGGGTGWSQSPTCRTLFCHLPYSFVPLSPDSRPLLCFSHYHVNHTVWLPILRLIGSALTLSKIKKCVVNRTTPHSPAQSMKQHAFDTSLHYAAKSSVFCELQLYRVSSQEGLPWMDFSPPHWKILRPIKMVFDDIWPDLLCRSYGESWQLVRQTRHTDTTDTVDIRVHVSCYLIHVLRCKRLGKVSNFTRSNAGFFNPKYEFSFSDFSRE